MKNMYVCRCEKEVRFRILETLLDVPKINCNVAKVMMNGRILDLENLIPIRSILEEPKCIRDLHKVRRIQKLIRGCIQNGSMIGNEHHVIVCRKYGNSFCYEPISMSECIAAVIRDDVEEMLWEAIL